MRTLLSFLSGALICLGLLVAGCDPAKNPVLFIGIAIVLIIVPAVFIEFIVNKQEK